jgi:signal transduction histidine kinase
MIDLEKTIASSISFVSRRIEEKRLTLIVDVPEHMPPVFADELRLKQILINLLSNAYKFTDEGGRIVVSAARCGGERVAVSILDTGCGMTAEQIVHVMKPFTQVRSDLARDHEGTGLGLPIANALVEKHGGTFDIASTPGMGTTVTFTLPIATSPNASTDELGTTAGGHP